MERSKRFSQIIFSLKNARSDCREEKSQDCPYSFDGGECRRSLMAEGVDHNDDIAGLSFRHERPTDIDHEGVAIDGAADYHRRHHVLTAQGRGKCRGFRMNVRNAGTQSLCACVAVKPLKAHASLMKTEWPGSRSD